jgi:hypothetical protein
MSEVELITAALAAGASAGAGSAATAAVQDAYSALKGLLRRWFDGRPQAEEALAAEITEVDALRRLLGDDLVQSGAARDVAVLDAALRLLATADPGIAAKYQVDVRDARGVQVGDHNTQTNTFN